MISHTPKLLFDDDDATLLLVLEAFNKSLDESGFIIDSNTMERVLTPEGDEIQKHQFGGMKKGSEIYLRDDLMTVINLAEGKF